MSSHKFPVIFHMFPLCFQSFTIFSHDFHIFFSFSHDFRSGVRHLRRKNRHAWLATLVRSCKRPTSAKAWDRDLSISMAVFCIDRYIYVYIYICICVFIYLFTYLWLFIHVYMYVYIYVCYPPQRSILFVFCQPQRGSMLLSIYDIIICVICIWV